MTRTPCSWSCLSFAIRCEARHLLSTILATRTCTIKSHNTERCQLRPFKQSRRPGRWGSAGGVVRANHRAISLNLFWKTNLTALGRALVPVQWKSIILLNCSFVCANVLCSGCLSVGQPGCLPAWLASDKRLLLKTSGHCAGEACNLNEVTANTPAACILARTRFHLLAIPVPVPIRCMLIKCLCHENADCWQQQHLHLHNWICMSGATWSVNAGSRSERVGPNFPICRWHVTALSFNQ